MSILWIIFWSILGIFAFYQSLLLISSLFFSSPEKTLKDATSKEPLFVFIPTLNPHAEFITHLARLKEKITDTSVHIYVLFQETPAPIIQYAQEFCDFYDHASFRHLEGNPYHHALRFAAQRMTSIAQEKNWATPNILILDPDNDISLESIQRMRALKERPNNDFIQVKRRPSNVSSSVASFDGISESLNDAMFRKAKCVWGGIPELSGSGMLLSVRRFKAAVNALDPQAPGMDKNLLIQLITQDDSLHIVYDEIASITDEKTNKSDQFGRQRLRWFGNQYYNAQVYGWKLVQLSLKRRSFAYADYAFTLWRPPRSFQLALTLLASAVELLLWVFSISVPPAATINALIWFPGIFLFLIIERPVSLRPKDIGEILTMSFKNGTIAFASLAKKIRGTFVSTRER